MAVNVRKGRNEQVTFNNEDIYLYSRQAVNGGIGDKTQVKAYSRCLFIMYMHLDNSLLTDKAPQTFMQNPRKEEQARKPLLLSEPG